MDARRNPYAPGAGTRPPALTGRDRELDAFDILVSRLREGLAEQSMLVTGLRGVGKTVLLNTFEDIAQERGFLTTYREASEHTRLPALVARSLRSMLEELSPTQKMRRSIGGILSRLSSFTLSDPNGFELSFELAAVRPDALADDFSDMLVQLGEAARAKDRGVAFLLDEVQFVRPDELGAFIVGLHRVSQKALPVTCVGCGLPQLPKLVGEAKSYAERLFTYPVIDRLGDDAAAEALARPAGNRGVEFRQDALDEVLHLTEGYPYFIQEYGKRIWNLVERSPITIGDVRRAAGEARTALDAGFYQVRLERTNDRERRYLRAMAELGAGPVGTGAIARELGLTSPTLSRVREGLLRKGLVFQPRHGYLGFSVPRFDDFLRRTYPFRSARPARRKRR